MTDTNDQPGACAPVPLPEPTHRITRWPLPRIPKSATSEAVSFLGYTRDEIIAYGEACAAHLREIALRATDQAQQAQAELKFRGPESERELAAARAKSAEIERCYWAAMNELTAVKRERDEQRARAEAAEADAARWKYAEAHLFRCDPDMGGNHRWWTQHLRGRGPTVAAVIDKEIADYTARKEAAEAKIAEMEGRRDG